VTSMLATAIFNHLLACSSLPATNGKRLCKGLE
jgi:hypothetical protein